MRQKHQNCGVLQSKLKFCTIYLNFVAISKHVYFPAAAGPTFVYFINSPKCRSVFYNGEVFGRKMSQVNCFIARNIFQSDDFSVSRPTLTQTHTHIHTYKLTPAALRHGEKNTRKFVQQIFVKSHNERREFSRQTAKYYSYGKGNMRHEKRKYKGVARKWKENPCTAYRHLSNTTTTTKTTMKKNKRKKRNLVHCFISLAQRVECCACALLLFSSNDAAYIRTKLAHIVCALVCVCVKNQHSQ